MSEEVREFVVETLVDICNIPVDKIGLRSHLIEELGVDSVDMLDVVHEIDRRFSITLPIEEWASAVARGEPSEDYFVLEKLVDRITCLRAPGTHDRNTQ